MLLGVDNKAADRQLKAKDREIAELQDSTPKSAFISLSSCTEKLAQQELKEAQKIIKDLRAAQDLRTTKDVQEARERQSSERKDRAEIGSLSAEVDGTLG